MKRLKRREESDMNKKDIKRYQKLLEEEREHLLLQLDFDKEQASELLKQEVGDIVDNAYNMYEKNRTIEIAENEKKKLMGINKALLRIKNNVFGVCIKCGNEIDHKRLDAVPWTVTCVNPESCSLSSKKGKK